VTDFKFMMRQLVRNPLSLAGLIIIAIFVIIAIFAPLSPHLPKVIWTLI